MEEKLKLLEILSFLKKHIYFYDGLIVLFILVASIYCLFANWLGPHLVALLKFYNCPDASNWGHLSFLIGFLLLLVAAFLFWRKKRAVSCFSKEELGILFAPNFSEDLEKEVELLFVNLNLELKSHEFLNRFSIKRLPPNISINSMEDATSVLRKSRGICAVWGVFDQEYTDQGRTAGFSRLALTFTSSERIHPLRHKALALSLAEKKLQIKERTQIADRQIMARDIGLVVRNVLGVVLLINQRYEEAIKIFSPMLIGMQALVNRQSSIALKRFRNQVKFDLAYSMIMLTSQQYLPYLFEKKLFSIPERTLRAWLNNVTQAIRLDPQNSTHYLSKAIYLFLLGEIEEAMASARQAKKTAPKALATPNFSLAFLYNFTGEFEKSKDEYKKGLGKKTSYDENLINQCLFFTRQCIEQFPDKKQLRFALALIEIQRGSKEQGLKELEEFVKNPPKEKNLESFVTEGKQLLENYLQKKR